MLERVAGWLPMAPEPSMSSGSGLGELLLLPFYLIRALIGVVELIAAGPIGIAILLGLVGLVAVFALVGRRRSDDGG